MTRANINDRILIVDILAKSFDDNQSVNYIIKQDSNRAQRIRKLMEYSFRICHRFAEVFLSDDRKGCALILYPEKKKTNVYSVLSDLDLIYGCTGLGNAAKAMKRESKIKKLHPQLPMYYLWFLGVSPNDQHQGTGSKLLSQLMSHASVQNRPIYLETSTLENIPWYEKFGFNIYNELDLGYRLYFLKKE